MSSDIGSTIRDELLDLLAPLEAAGADADSLIRFLAALGHTPAFSGDPTLLPIVQSASAITQSLAALDDTSLDSWDGIAKLLDTGRKTSALFAQVKQFAQDPARIAVAGALADEVTARLFADYLRRRHPKFFRLASALKLIEAHEHGPYDAPIMQGRVTARYSRALDRIQFGTISALFTNPGATLGTVYFPNGMAAAADAWTAAERLFPRLASLADAIGLPWTSEHRPLVPVVPPGQLLDLDPSYDALLVRVDEGLIDEPVPAPVAAIKPEFYAASFPKFRVRLAQSGANELAIVLEASSTKHANATPGFTLVIVGNLGGSVDVGSWRIGYTAQGQVPPFAITTTGVRLVQGATPVAGGAAHVTAERIPPAGAAGPAVVIGNPQGTRLELGSVKFDAGLLFDTAQQGLSLSADVTQAAIVVAPGDNDSFLASLLPSGGLRAALNLGLTWTSGKGVSLRGGGLSASLPVGLTIGGSGLTNVNLGITPDATNGGALRAEVSADLAANIGPLKASIGRVGLAGTLRFPPGGGNLGAADLSLGLQPPASVGLSVDIAGVVSGSGFLFVDATQGLYAGAMRLTLHNQLTLTALGLIQTRLPDGQPGYSLLIFITAEGFQPIQLGLGFMLTGIGGMVGVNRTFDETVLREGLKTDTLATLLFPRDPASNAMAIVRSLASAFPPKAGSYLLGLLAKICWGPAQLLQFDLALILELGARTRLLALGRVSALVPSPDNDLVRLKGDVMGVLDLDAGTLAVDAVLVDSRVAHKFAITGAGAFRAGWGSGPGSAFIYSIGGFNPRFVPPAGLPTLDRVTVALASGSNPRFTCEAYFAITSNTLQFGARAELYASYGGFTLLGDVGFDVLMTSLSHFIADFHASVQLKRGSHNLFKVAVQGTLEGARPLRLSGKATFEILWCDFSVSFHATLVDGVAPVAAALDAIAPVLAALAQPENWRTVPGPTPHGVSLRKVPSGSALAVDPLGKLEVTQSVVPLGTARDVDTVGGARVSGDRRFNLTAQLGGGATTQTAPVFGSFAPGQYFAMSDDEKLASPSFETMQAGVGLGSDGVAIDESATGLVSASLTYQVLVLEGATLTPVVTATAVTHDVSVGKLVAQAATGAAAKAPVRQVGRSRFATEAGPAVTLPGPKWAIMPVMGGTSTPAAQVAVQQAMVRVGIADAMLAASTLAPQMMPPQSAPVPVINTWSEYRAVVDTLNQGGTAWQIVPEHELV